MPPFLHLFCFVPKRNTTLTKTFATPKSFTKGLVLLSVYIIAYFSNSHNIDFATFADYSLSEINTGIKWVDGKVIYKKTIDFGTLPNSALKTVPHNISNLGYILKIEGIAKRATDGIFFQIGNALNPDSQSFSVSIHISADSANIGITTGMDRRDMAAYVTLYYTKTV